jgi:hypothetical protein
MIIDKPGFYESKAGKCEVVAVKVGYVSWAIGWCDDRPVIWGAGSGRVEYAAGLDSTAALDITGPWPPRKPVEAWAVDRGCGCYELFLLRDDAIKLQMQPIGSSSLIRLIEAPE